MSDALFKAVDDSKTEADFLEVLRGCAEADVKYRDRGGFTVLMAIAIEHDCAGNGMRVREWAVV